MGDKTAIEWCDFTFNPWIGCTKISPGCDNCYAAAQNKFRGWVKQWGEPGQAGDYRRTSEANWKKPLQWARRARAERQAWEARRSVEERLHPSERAPEPGRPRVFCASLADVFDNQVPAEWRYDLFEMISRTQELDWLLLTKRPENIEKMLTKAVSVAGLARQWPWTNVWLGFTAEDQEHFDRRWPIIRDIPAAVRFCSYEPALGPLRLYADPDGYRFVEGLHWLICGGESGHGYREMLPEWESNVRLDCELAGVAYFLKQNAGKKPFPDGRPIVRQFPT